MFKDRYLYRGVNPSLYMKTGGKLTPKAIGHEFKRSIKYGEGAKYGEGTKYGTSESNAVIMHQKDSSKYPSSGVSTTPVLENAKKYATHCGLYKSGFVYKVDTQLFDEAGVTAYPVSDYARKPAIPGDQEVILVAKDNGALPDTIVVEVIAI